MRHALFLLLAVSLVGCDLFGAGAPQPGTFTASLRGDDRADLSGTAVVRRDSVRRFDPVAGLYYEDRYTVEMDGAGGSAGVELPGEPETLDVTNTSLLVWVSPAEGRGYSTGRLGTLRVRLSTRIVGGELVGDVDADLRSGGNPLAGISSREARGRGRFSAALPE